LNFEVGSPKTVVDVAPCVDFLDQKVVERGMEGCSMNGNEFGEGTAIADIFPC